MNQQEIDVARDFSRYPAGRFLDDGPNSGQRFREEVLLRHLQEGGYVLILLDSAEGYGSSFLEEAFGGLVRLGIFTAEDLHRRVKFETRDPSYEKEIWEYIDCARVGDES